jgi:hypothetical protein
MATLNKAKKSSAPAAPAKKIAPAKKASATKAAPARKKATSARPPKPTWQAPADFKPAFFRFGFSTDSQALIVPESANGERIRGRWDNEEAKRYNLREYDVNSLMGFIARMSAAIWAPNVIRRITPDATWEIIVRVNKRSADGSLAVRVIGVRIKKEGKKARWIEDKTDADLRKIRRAARWLPAAFTDVQLPPSRRSKKSEEADEE